MVSGYPYYCGLLSIDILLPEKIEGKLFIATLLICFIASLLTSRYILSSEHDRLVSDTKMCLTAKAGQHGLEVLKLIDEHEALGRNAGEQIKTALAG